MKLQKTINNYLITESDVVTGKSQTDTVGRGFRFYLNDRTVEVIKLFIIWRKYTGFLITLCFLFASP